MLFGRVTVVTAGFKGNSRHGAIHPVFSSTKTLLHQGGRSHRNVAGAFRFGYRWRGPPPDYKKNVQPYSSIDSRGRSFRPLSSYAET